MKKLISILFAMLIIWPVMAEVHSGSCGANLTWTLDTSSGALQIEGSGEMDNYQGLTDAPWMPYKNTIHTILLPANLTTIGDNAFPQCTSLESVNIPNCVSKIGTSAFFYCISLNGISIPESVTNISYGAFMGCSSLTSISIPESVTIIEDGTFSACSSLSSISIPESVTYIGRSAFNKCSSLSSFSIPEGIKTICDDTFYDCISLTSIVLPEGVESIGSTAFYGCTSLELVSIPSSLDSFGQYAFRECRNIKTVYWNTDHYAEPFHKATIENVYFGDSVTTVHKTFSYCNKLQKVVLGKNVAHLNHNAFECCFFKEFYVTGDEVPGGAEFDISQTINAVLYVPESKLSYYQTYSPWCDFGTIIANGQNEPNIINGHSYVDLGLPSGNLWALCNVGASAPGKYGDYFEWSQCSNIPSDWGSNWHTPSEPEMLELVDNCSWNWTSIGNPGYKITGPNGNFIFLPASGFMLTTGGGIQAKDEQLYYWTTTLGESDFAYALAASSTTINDNTTWNTKIMKCSIRPCAKSKNFINATSICLNNQNISLLVGESCTLTATVLPSDASDKSISWKSSNTSVATVNDGVVTAISVGTATISATTNDGSDLTSTCQVTVTDPIVNATGISLNLSSITLDTGQSVTLTATVSPDNVTDSSVTWKSSNKDVAIVDNGFVQSIAAGTVTISATTNDGSNLSATCQITVIDPMINVSSLTLNRSYVELDEGDKFVLEAEIEPRNATNQDIIWTTTDDSVISVESGIVTAIGIGNARVVATAADGTGSTASCRIAVEESIARQLVVEMNDGQKLIYQLKDLPELTLSGNLMIIQSRKLADSIERRQIRRFYFEESAQSSINNVEGDNREIRIIYTEPDEIRIEGFDTPKAVMLFSLRGKYITCGTLSPDGGVTVDLTGCPQGFYILKLPNHESIKILH